MDLSLYLVADPTMMRRRSVAQVIEEAVRGGVTAVQLREKGCSNEEFLQLARQVVDLLAKYQVPLIINDRIDVALVVGAQGVHLGQSDLHWSEARKLLGPDAIIGVSVEDMNQVLELRDARVDYLGVSSVFPTETKKDVRKIWGLEGLKAIRPVTNQLLVGIGGINRDNAASVLNAGADGIAIVSAICSASAPKSAAQKFRKVIDER